MSLPKEVKMKAVGGSAKFTWNRTYRLVENTRSVQECEFCGEKILYDEPRYKRGGWAHQQYAHIECTLNPFCWDECRTIAPFYSTMSCPIRGGLVRDSG